jgi:polysaccharide deacetylase family protein (PEP-CTERM system associated)
MNVLTFDIEEWFHILDHESTESIKRWDSFESRIHANMARLLRFLTDQSQSATFFCLGWICRKYPELIRDIDALGFEIGTHSDMHQLVYNQTRDEFRSDLDASIGWLEDLTGKKIAAYRAPGFSVTEATLWAFEILAERGIELDCSVFTAPRAHGGYKDFPSARPCWIETGGCRLKEFPVGHYPVGPLRIAFSGGGYMRLLPYRVIRYMMKRAGYSMVYLHYRDFDYGQAVIKELPPYRRFKSYVGIKSTFGKLERLIKDFDFVDLRTADKQVDWSTAPTVRL